MATNGTTNGKAKAEESSSEEESEDEKPAPKVRNIIYIIEVWKDRGLKGWNYPFNFVWTVSLSLVNKGWISLQL